MIEIIELSGIQSAEATQPPIPEAQIATMRELAAEYWATLLPSHMQMMTDKLPKECPQFPFRLGDVVTPRPGIILRCEGKPHLVVEIRPIAPPEPHFEGWRTAAFGARLNLRVMTWKAGAYCMFWNEAWMHVPYVGPTGSN